MSLHKGLTSWILRTGPVTVAYRWNMTLSQAMGTFKVCRGAGHFALACGPLILETTF